MRFTRPTTLILLLVLGQVVVMVGGLFVFEEWLGPRLRGVAVDRWEASRREAGLAVVERLQALDEASKSDGDGDGDGAGVLWAEAARSVPLQDGGYVTLVDLETDRLLAHPEAARVGAVDPLVARLRRRQSDAGHGVLLAEPAALGAAPTRLMTEDELVVPTVALGRDVLVLVHQPLGPVEEQVAVLRAQVRSGGVLLGSMLLLVSAGVTWLVVRRFRSALAEANAALATVNEGLNAKVERRTAQLRKNRDAVVYAVARVAESRDEATGRHLERISRYTELIAGAVAARRPELDADWVRTVALTAMLHDVGKVGIPDDVLLKPGPLTADERETVQQHPAIGGDTLDAIRRQWGADPFLDTAHEIALGHHERWDGQGYPRGTAGEAIPLAARVAALADVYDALTSARPYKPALAHEEAVRRISAGAGTQFDPAVVECFLAVSDDLDAARRALIDAAAPAPHPAPRGTASAVSP